MRYANTPGLVSFYTPVQLRTAHFLRSCLVLVYLLEIEYFAYRGAYGGRWLRGILVAEGVFYENS